MQPYEVFAVRYAHHAERRASDNFIQTDLHEAGSPLDFFVWVVRNSERTIVVDTGFNAATAKRRNRKLLRSPIEGLKALGVDAATVEDVVITHLHYDHVGNYDLFPKARFHLQDKEMQFATGRCMCHAPMRHAFEADHVVGMVRNVFAGRVAFHDGEAEVAPGITLHHVGGHTMGLQIVRVLTKRGYVVLAADASHLYANMDAVRPFPIVYNVADMLEGYGTIRRLADSPGHIIPGHDPLVMRRYPAPNKAMQDMVVRLDVKPKQVD